MISFQQEINAEFELSEEELAYNIYYCGTAKNQARFLNVYVKNHLNRINLHEIKEISKNLTPETKEFLLKLCDENKD